MHLLRVLLFVSMMSSTTSLLLLDIVSFALDLHDFISGVSRKPEIPEVYIRKEQVQSLLDNIHKGIALSTETVVSFHGLESQLSELRELDKVTHSLLKTLEQVLTSTSRASKTEYSERFKNYFENHKDKFDNMDRLLNGNLPSGLSAGLLYKIAKHVNCNITALKEFESYYMQMASMATALEVAYETFSKVNHSNKTIEDWTRMIRTLQTRFTTQEEYCKSKFQELATADFKEIVDYNTFARNNRMRYSDKYNDVIIVTDKSNYKMAYDVNDPLLFVDKSHEHLRVSVFTSKTENQTNQNTDIELMMVLRQQFVSVCPPNDVDAFKVLGNEVEYMYRLKRRHRRSRLWLLYQGKPTAAAIDIDIGSAVQQMETDCRGIVLVMYVNPNVNQLPLASYRIEENYHSSAFQGPLVSTSLLFCLLLFIINKDFLF